MARSARVIWLILHPLPMLPDIWDLVVAVAVLSGATAGVGASVGWAADSVPQGIAGGLATLFALLAFLAATTCWRLQRELDKLAQSPEPNVVLDGFDPVLSQPQQVIRYGEARQFLAEFSRVRIVNEPQHRGDEATAKDLNGRIWMYDETGGRRVLEVRNARFADNPEQWQEAARGIKSIDLPGSGRSAIVDIATKAHGEEECFGWDNGGRVGDGLPRGTYQVELRLEAANMEPRTFWFTLINPGKEGNFQLRERQGYSNVASGEWAD